MDLKYVKQLLEMVEKSAVNEIELEEKGNKIRITKSAPQNIMSAPAYQMAMPAAPAPIAYQPSQVPPASAKPSATAEGKKYHEVNHLSSERFIGPLHRTQPHMLRSVQK